MEFGNSISELYCEDRAGVIFTLPDGTMVFSDGKVLTKEEFAEGMKKIARNNFKSYEPFARVFHLNGPDLDLDEVSELTRQSPELTRKYLDRFCGAGLASKKEVDGKPVYTMTGDNLRDFCKAFGLCYVKKPEL